MSQNTKKLKELILYISKSYANTKFFGKTKLAKLLFAIDFDAYTKLSRPVTGARYKKYKRGPMPYSLLPIVREMEQNGELELIAEEVEGLPQSKPKALRKPDLESFSEDEMNIVNKWIENMRDLRAVTLSSWSHGLEIWKYADESGFIPYNRVYWKFPQNENVTEKDVIKVRSIVERTGGKYRPRPD